MKLAVAGKSPPGVLMVTSHLPPASPAGTGGSVVVGIAAPGLVGVGVAASAVLPGRFMVNGPSPKPPNWAVPFTASLATLPFITMSIEAPWIGIANENLSSSLTNVPSTGSSPCGPLNMPVTFSPSCLRFSGTVRVPVGDWMVNSQSPATVVCANVGTATSSAARTRLARVMTVGSLKEKSLRGRKMLLRVPAHPARLERPFADVAQPCHAGDVLALDFALHRDLQRRARIGDGPRDGHLIVGDAAFQRELAVFVDDAPAQLGLALIDRHVDAHLAARHDELDAPVAGDVGGGRRRGQCREQRA